MPRAIQPPQPITAPVAPANLFVGTSGWAYPSWKPGFYPSTVPGRYFLRHYGSQLNAVEVNYTFRTLPSPTQLENWLSNVPESFRFSFKAPQRITHFARLRECQTHVDSFLEALAPARERSGPLLFQLPPNFKADRELLARFLGLPAFERYAAQLAFEFRHTSWFANEIYAVLHDHNAALCVAESDELTTPDVQTARHRCYRLRLAGGYGETDLDAMAERYTAAAGDGQVYLFFKHEDEPTGALNAVHLLRKAAAIGEAVSAEGCQS